VQFHVPVALAIATSCRYQMVTKVPPPPPPRPGSDEEEENQMVSETEAQSLIPSPPYSTDSYPSSLIRRDAKANTAKKLI
jgi:hypothetical protein